MLNIVKFNTAKLNVSKPSRIRMSEQEETIETLRELLGEHIEEVGRLIEENQKLRKEIIYLERKLSEYEES